MLMITRLAIPPGIAWWEPWLGIVVVLVTTLFCVWAASRIFRIGILMQGKGARFGELIKWIWQG
jgi:ABC-2 type transport system permease protein